MPDSKSFTYDVAFSFLASDLTRAEQLAEGLEPALSTFVYSRKKEELLGGDGMDLFAAVFGTDSRLAVILYRAAWGRTPWTAFEETHIKSRALATRMTSFLVVRLDDADVPVWVPDTHLYASTATDSHAEIVGAIKRCARQQGAQLRTESPQEMAQRLTRARLSHREREDRYRSPGATLEVQAEVAVLFDELVRLSQVIRAGPPSVEIEAGHNELECAVSCPRGSISLAWQQSYDNSLKHGLLRVNHWKGRVRVPRRPSERAGGPDWHYAVHYLPELSEHNEWVWRCHPSMDDFGDDEGGVLVLGPMSSPETYRALELADHLLRKLIERCLG